MKKYAFPILLALVATGALALTPAGGAQAQKGKWAPKHGFWVVTTQPGTPAVVRFYDLQQHLICEEKLDRERLDIRKRAVQKSLYHRLEAAVAAYRLRADSLVRK